MEQDCHNLFLVRSVGMFGFPAPPPFLTTCSQTLYVADQGDISQDSGETVKPGGQPEESVENSDTVIVEVFPPVQAEGGMCHTSTFTYRLGMSRSSSPPTTFKIKIR